jgi:P27 family predicted phage terminase small subunit
MRGRKLKPDQLKILQGTFRNDRHNADQPEFKGDLIQAPAHFSKEQSDCWNYAITHAPRGLLKKIDMSTLEIWVVACVFHRQAAEEVARNGQVCTAPSGYMQTNPYMTNMNRQAQIMLKAAEQMGFTPASRGKVSIKEEVESYDPWKNLAEN